MIVQDEISVEVVDYQNIVLNLRYDLETKNISTYGFLPDEHFNRLKILMDLINEQRYVKPLQMSKLQFSEGKETLFEFKPTKELLLLLI